MDKYVTSYHIMLCMWILLFKNHSLASVPPNLGRLQICGPKRNDFFLFISSMVTIQKKGLRARLDWAETAEMRICISAFFFFFSHVSGQFFYCLFTVAATVHKQQQQNLTFSTFLAQISLFMDSQISLFNNFFIKNGSHSTIHTFKNYFADKVQLQNWLQP